MSKPDESINPKLLESAKEEFLVHGFEKASTNVICKNAGVTSGALFKRYASKEDLFRALVEPVAMGFKKRLVNESQAFGKLSKEEQEEKALTFNPEGFDMVTYMYDYFDEFKLILECSHGTEFEHYFDEIVEIIVENNRIYFKDMQHEAVILGKKVTPEMIHMITNAYLSGLFEPIRHKMLKEDAKIYIEQLEYFFMIGWSNILNLPYKHNR